MNGFSLSINLNHIEGVIENFPSFYCQIKPPPTPSITTIISMVCSVLFLCIITHKHTYTYNTHTQFNIFLIFYSNDGNILSILSLALLSTKYANDLSLSTEIDSYKIFNNYVLLYIHFYTSGHLNKCQFFIILSSTAIIYTKLCLHLSGTSLVAQTVSICLQCGRPRFNPWVRKTSWRRKWQPTPVLLPGKFHGWRSLVGYSPWGRKESDTTEPLQSQCQ